MVVQPNGRERTGYRTLFPVAFGGDADVPEVFPLPFKDVDEVHHRTACERGERYLHRSEAEAFAADPGSAINQEGVTFAVVSLELNLTVEPGQVDGHVEGYHHSARDWSRTRFTPTLRCMRVFTIDETIGRTPLVRLQKVHQGPVPVLCKLEGDNPAGSVKDRPALSMIVEAEKRGRIKPGDTLIEATSGNTGIALAMVAAVRGYRMVLVMPEHMSLERRDIMRAYGAELVLTPQGESMEGAIETARAMEARGEGVILDQFGNPDNPLAHYTTTGPEIWDDTDGRVTHFVASTGTTGTIMGTSRYLKEVKPDLSIVGVRPDSEGGIPGIRAWPEAYLPKIYEPERVDDFRMVSRAEAVSMTRRLAREEGIFAGISSGGNVHVAVTVATELQEAGRNDAVVVVIICDRGDRYLSTGVFSDG